MNSTLLIKLLGGLTATVGVGTGGYFIKEHFSKSKEETDEKPTVVANPKVENTTSADVQSPTIKPTGDAIGTNTDTAQKVDSPQQDSLDSAQGAGVGTEANESGALTPPGSSETEEIPAAETAGQSERSTVETRDTAN